MKIICHFILLFLLVTFFLSCSKSKADVQQPNVNSSILPGVWEYRFGYVQIANPNPAIFAPGNGNIWKFSDNHYQKIDNDSVYYSGTYSISRGTGIDPNTGEKVDQFIFDGVSSLPFLLANDTLHFYYGLIAADGTIDDYVKISDDTTLSIIHR